MHTPKLKMLVTASLIVLGFAMFSCKEESVSIVKPDVSFFALVDGKQLIKVNAMNSEMATATTLITGLLASDALTAIDFRPATGELYGVSTQNRLYRPHLCSQTF